MRLHVGGGELHIHQIALFDPDAVLAGQAAAHLDTELENVVARILGLLRLARQRAGLNLVDLLPLRPTERRIGRFALLRPLLFLP